MPYANVHKAPCCLVATQTYLHSEVLLLARGDHRPELISVHSCRQPSFSQSHSRCLTCATVAHSRVATIVTSPRAPNSMATTQATQKQRSIFTKHYERLKEVEQVRSFLRSGPTPWPWRPVTILWPPAESCESHTDRQPSNGGVIANF